MAHPYNLPKIRQLLTEGFTDAELRRFCYDTPDFRVVYDELASTSGKADVIHRLIEHADRKGLLAPLLDWAKAENPAKFSEYHPYTADKIPSKPLGQNRDRRNRQAMLKLVQDFWVKGVLENSLYGTILIELGLEERNEAVEHPWEMILQVPNRPNRLLAPGVKMVEVFDEMGQALLILGEPGSGKTTLLLELARELIERAEQETAHPIPVVLNLSSWTAKKLPIAEWLVEELITKYNIPRNVARLWLVNDELLLLLDGLDEVAPGSREACVKAVNDFRYEHLVPMAVCSRIADYEALANRLRLQNAVLLQPFTPQQIETYFEQAGPELEAVRTLLQKDVILQELARSPLMLSVITIAYSKLPPEMIYSINTLEARRKHLFDTYLDQMFKRRGINKEYSPQQTTQWLAWLAQKMLKYNESIFLVERIGPDWLPSGRDKWLYTIGLTLTTVLPVALSLGFGAGFPLRLAAPQIWPVFVGGIALSAGVAIWLAIRRIFGLMGSLLVGTTFGLTFGWTFSTNYSLATGVSTGLALGLAAGAAFGLIGKTLAGKTTQGRNKIEIVERLNWSWSKAVPGLIIGGIAGFVFGLIVRQTIRWPIALNFGVAFALASGIVAGLLSGLTSSEVEIKTKPNQGIRQSRRNAAFIGLVVFIATGLATGMASGMAWANLPGQTGLTVGLTSGLLIGLAFGLGLGLLFGGLAVVQHYLLRAFLSRNGCIPPNLVHFLDYCSKHIFLRKVGGGYIFIHRLLMEHFASLKPEQTE